MCALAVLWVSKYLSAPNEKFPDKLILALFVPAVDVETSV